MKKIDLACAIEAHHLYQPVFCNSKRYFHYNADREIRWLMKKTKAELRDMYELAYAGGRELENKKINW